LEGPVMLTNTHSVGVVRDAVVAWAYENSLFDALADDTFWSLPVVAETYDGALNDINGFHVKPEHVFAALDGASSGPLEQGNVGGGTGMVCHQFKGGIGTASRLVKLGSTYTVGALVQANYGSRRHLTVAGVPVGREISDLLPVTQPGGRDQAGGSIIAVVATDAPLLPHQLKRLARRVPLGIAKVGGLGENSSGDIFVAFSTGNSGAARRSGVAQLEMLSNDELTPFFAATVQATEQAIVSALLAAETMTGINGNTVYALPHGRLTEALCKYNRWVE
jgi:L-aminopeptidase/D-esterase-like protein